jgi:hypothetical protein
MMLLISRRATLSSSTKVKGFVSPQSWFVDLTLVSVQ